MKINLSAYHPIIDIRENLVFANNGNLILCYEADLPEVYSLSEKDFEDLHSVWFQGLRSLMSGCVVHKQDIYRKKEFSCEGIPNESFLERATYKYFQGKQYLEHRCFLYFIWPGNRAFNRSKYFNPFKKASGEIPRKAQAYAQDFKRAVEDTVSFINNSKKLNLSPVYQDEILGMVDSFFNGFNNDYNSGILLDHAHPCAGGNYFDILALNSELEFGENIQSSKTNDRFTTDDFVFHQGFIDGLGLNLDENHMVNQVLFMDDRHRWRRILEKRIGELRKSIQFGSQNKIILSKVEAILDRINQDDTSRIIRGHLNVIFWDSKEKNLSRIASKINTQFKEIDIKPYAPPGEERKNYFLNSFFCFSSNFSDQDLYVADLKHALCLLINNTGYKSDKTGIIFNDRQYNIPVLKDVWDEKKKRIKARNFAIFAPTGEGKSFLANNILRQYFENGVRLVIIDLGGSYHKFAQLYPDDHLILRYEQGKNLGINPFYVSENEEPGPRHLEELSTFLLELFSSGSKAEKGQEVAIKKILQHYYNSVSRPHSLESFYAFIEANRNILLNELGIHQSYFETDRFLHIMSEYVKDGLYSYLFDISGKENFSVEDKRLIIFELDEVRDNREILSVMLKLIKSAIQRTIWKNKSEKGIILFDEFAKQLKFDNVLESVEFYYQAIRKQNGAIGVILQSINQLPQNSTSASILENTQVIYSLHNEKGYDQLHERLHLSSHDLNQLRSIRNKLYGRRKYTEIFIKIGKQSNVFRLEVPPEVYSAYLTDGRENSEIMALFEGCGSMEEAITDYITKNKQ